MTVGKFGKYFKDRGLQIIRYQQNASLRSGVVNDQDQDQDSLLVKRRNDNHSSGPMIRELVPSSH